MARDPGVSVFILFDSKAYQWRLNFFPHWSNPPKGSLSPGDALVFCVEYLDSVNPGDVEALREFLPDIFIMREA